MNSAARLPILGAALLVVLTGAMVGPWAGPEPGRAASTFEVSLSATPSYGTPPLTVSFEATATSGSPTAYNWSFGDGTYYNGTNASASAPSHTFAEPGLYNVSVGVYEGAAFGSGTIEVHVVAELLAAQVSASATAGTAPLTVTFSATVTGGTGTYVNFSWAFGDGGSGSGPAVRYTFEHAGAYHVVLTVYDSANATTTAGTWVNVTSTAGPPASLGTTLLSLAPWIVGAFLAGVVAVVLVGRYRGSFRRPPESGVPPAAPPGTATEGVPPTAPPGDGVLISHRVVLHLAQLGRLGSDEVAVAGFTQGGMATALNVPQTSLTNVLRRLGAAGILTEDVRHVHGRDRRLKVYRLTARGEELARELRHRAPSP